MSIAEAASQLLKIVDRKFDSGEKDLGIKSDKS